MKLVNVRFEKKLSSIMIGLSWQHFYSVQNVRHDWDIPFRSKIATEVKVAFFPCFSLIFRFAYTD